MATPWRYLTRFVLSKNNAHCRVRLFLIALLCLIFHEFHLRRKTVAAHFPKHRDRKLQGIGSLCPDGNTANPSWAGGTYAAAKIVICILKFTLRVKKISLPNNFLQISSAAENYCNSFSQTSRSKIAGYWLPLLWWQHRKPIMSRRNLCCR